MIYSLALGQTAWLIRLASALFCGVIAGFVYGGSLRDALSFILMVWLRQ